MSGDIPRGSEHVETEHDLERLGSSGEPRRCPRCRGAAVELHAVGTPDGFVEHWCDECARDEHERPIHETSTRDILIVLVVGVALAVLNALILAWIGGRK